MSSILHKIVADKRADVEELKAGLPLQDLRKRVDPQTHLDFEAALRNTASVNIIAEIKRGSPSKGMLTADFNPAIIAEQYRDGGAAALSVLTEEKYFFGRYEFLALAKRRSGLPVLCKDFIFDEYQVYYAKYVQADAILLIARLLPPDTLREFLALAESIGLACLVESHNEREVELAVNAGARIIGVNNRNLDDFSVSLETSERLAPLIPSHVVKVAESGIFTRDDITRLQSAGYNSFLIGEALITAGDPIELLHSLRGA